MGYSWYRTDSAYHRHPKMLALKAELKEPLADAYVSRLWSWTQVYSPSGRFSVVLVDGLESELGWTGSKGSLAAALEKTGWLDRVGDQFEVHDWPDFQGYLVKKSKKDADKKRKRRARASARTAPSVRADGAAPSPRTAPPTDVTDGRNETDVTEPSVAPTALMPGPVDLAHAWNTDTTAPLPKVTLPLGKTRERAFKDALTRRTLPVWRQVFQRINASAFCRGDSDTKWVADVDWATRPEGKKPEPATKVLEGAYDRHAAPNARRDEPVARPEGLVTL